MSNTNNKIEIKCFDHMQMDVANLEESIEFYSNIFGFELTEVGMRASTRWAIIGNKNQLFLCMHEYPEGRGQVNSGLEITHFGLIVDDYSTCRQRLESFNVPLVYSKDVVYHSSRSLYFWDPNGYKIEISEKHGGGLLPPSLQRVA